MAKRPGVGGGGGRAGKGARVEAAAAEEEAPVVEFDVTCACDKLWKILSVVAESNKEVTLEFLPDGLFINALSPDHSTIVRLVMPVASWGEGNYTCAPDGKVVDLQVEKLWNLLKKLNEAKENKTVRLFKHQHEEKVQLILINELKTRRTVIPLDILVLQTEKMDPVEQTEYGTTFHIGSAEVGFLERLATVRKNECLSITRQGSQILFSTNGDDPYAHEEGKITIDEGTLGGEALLASKTFTMLAKACVSLKPDPKEGEGDYNLKIWLPLENRVLFKACFTGQDGVTIEFFCGQKTAL